MQKKRVAELPKCSFDNNKAKYDAPTKNGQWAFMCPECFMDKGNDPGGIGTEFQEGIAESVDKEAVGICDMETSMTEDNLTVKCGHCKEVRRLETDATGTYDCHGCGYSVSIPSLF